MTTTRGAEIPPPVHPQPVSDPLTRRALVVTGAATVAFAILTLAVKTTADPLDVDLWLHGWLELHRTPALTFVALAVTSTGASAVLVPLIFLVAFAASRGPWTRRLAVALFSAGVVLLGVGIRLGVSDLVARSRPPQSDWAGYASGYAFPSGHSTAAALATGLLLWLVACRLEGSSRFPALSGVAAWGVAVGLTRAYLGVHWPTDVLGAWILSSACLCAAGATARWACGHRTTPEG